MIASLFNFLFRCWHRRTTLPLRQHEGSGEEMYVVCLECGKHLTYDAARGRIGKALPQ